METKKNQWFMYVNSMYNKILLDSEKFDSGSIIVDIDETVLYNTVHEIPRAAEFINKLSEKFDIYFVTGRINSEQRRKDTVADLKNFNYKGLILRPEGVKHNEFKLKIKEKIKPIFTIADQEVDFPDYLIKNPYYYIDNNGDEIYFSSVNDESS